MSRRKQRVNRIGLDAVALRNLEASVKSSQAVAVPATPSFTPLAATHRMHGAANATAMTASAMTANTTILSPFVAPGDFAASSIRLQVATGVASSTFQLGVYASGSNGWPTGAPLLTTADLSGATATDLSAVILLSVTKGTQYWLACKAGATAPNVRRIAVGGCWSLGQSAIGTAVSSCLLVSGASWPNFTTNPVSTATLSTLTPPAVMLTT
jgi:hypothetical protein